MTWTPENITALIVAITALVGTVLGYFTAKKASNKASDLQKQVVNHNHNGDNNAP